MHGITLNRQWLLARRPTGRLAMNDLVYATVAVDDQPLAAGEVRVRHTLFLCAPTMRNWMAPVPGSLHPTVALGSPVLAPAGGRVIASAAPEMPVGTLVTGLGSWQDIQRYDAGALTVVSPGLSLIEAMGVVGINSLTAYFGMLRVGHPQAGDTVVVSGAAGSTGSVAAQIAKLSGCRVIGIAGDAAKCRWLIDECGLDAVIDYRNEDVSARLAALCPEGIDVFFDNVGGTTLQAAVDNMARHGRIVLCGQIAGYEGDGPVVGPQNMMRLIYGSIVMQGFLGGDYAAENAAAQLDLKRWIDAGVLKYRIDLRNGFDNLPVIFSSLFDGSNSGTLIAAIEHDAAVT